jgi:hypothetical protein
LEIVKEDLLAFFDDLHDGKLDLIIMNYGIITLIPKKEWGQRYQTIWANLFA